VSFIFTWVTPSNRVEKSASAMALKKETVTWVAFSCVESDQRRPAPANRKPAFAYAKPVFTFYPKARASSAFSQKAKTHAFRRGFSE
jgi:hypothetical protein